MRRSNFPLRLASSLLEEAKKVAEDEGVAVNQLINIAVAEKISALRTEDFFRERAQRANVPEALRILSRAGTEAPRAGDEIPDDLSSTVDPATDILLRKSIRTKHLVRFAYEGQERVAEPHDYGIQNGIARLFCYQVGGRSSGSLPGWRMVDVSGIKDYEILVRRFAGNRAAPSSQHLHWDKIFVRVGLPSE